VDSEKFLYHCQLLHSMWMVKTMVFIRFPAVPVGILFAVAKIVSNANCQLDLLYAPGHNGVHSNERQNGRTLIHLICWSVVTTLPLTCLIFRGRFDC